MMRYLITGLMALLLASCGPTSRSRKTNPALLDELLARGLEQKEMAGLQVLHKTSAKDKSVAVALIFTGGVRHYPATQDGIEALALQAALQGSTQDYAAQEIQDKLRAMGTRINASAGLEYSVVQLQCLEKHFAASWDLLMQLLMFAAMDEKEMRKVQDDYAATLLASEANEANEASLRALAKATGNHAYARRPEGRYAIVHNMQPDSIRSHYSRLLRRERMRLVLVGAVNEEALLLNLQNSLAVLRPEPPKVVAEISRLVLNEKPIFDNAELGQVYTLAYLPMPPTGSADALALALGLAILEDRLQADLCVRKGLSCQISVAEAALSQNYAHISMASNNANAATRALLEVIKAARVGNCTEQEVQDKKAQLFTRLYSQLDTNPGQASLLARYLALGSWQALLATPAQLRSLNAELVNKAMLKYMARMHWVLVGPTGNVGRGIFEGH